VYVDLDIRELCTLFMTTINEWSTTMAVKYLLNGKVKVIGLAAAAALTLAACGDSDSSDEATTSPTTTAEATTEATDEASTQDVVGVIAGNADTTTLATAVDAAGLVETLQGDGPFTVFAPTDEAFAALPAGVLDQLIQPANSAALTQILTYHVVPGKVMAADVTDGAVATVEGQDITLSTADGVTVNGATVTEADLDASNGVVHVIDTVLLPPGFDPATLQ
jgi:uncharacterized surface protein with fasciclin (FAS1) repeats